MGHGFTSQPTPRHRRARIGGGRWHVGLQGALWGAFALSARSTAARGPTLYCGARDKVCVSVCAINGVAVRLFVYVPCVHAFADTEGGANSN